jgi:uncharacterized protein (TIGR03083 family)
MTAAIVEAAPRQPALDRGLAMRLAAAEYERFLDALRELSDADWHRPTVNTGWDVHAMACHTLGMAEMAASVPEQLRQMRAANKNKGDGPMVDALTALQVAKHVHRSPADVTNLFEQVGPKAAKGRRRTPGLMRNRTMPDQPIDNLGNTESWTIGYLVDVILTRDPWMHRSDIAEATGRPMTLTAEHDGVIVADVVAEWAQRHGQPCTLTLTGPAGGTWSWGGVDGGGGGEQIELDAVEFCRILSGRGSGSGLLETRVPF